MHTDRREAVPRARLRRSGARTPVAVPAGDDDAIRDLSRARDEASGARQAATRRLHACGLRHALRATGRATGGPAHRRWLRAVGGPPPAPPSVGQASVRTVTAPTARLPRLDQAREDPGTAWRLAPGGDALHARRGVQGTVAVPRGAAGGALTRVDTPRQRRRSRGLPPAEDARGERRRQGSRAGGPWRSLDR